MINIKISVAARYMTGMILRFLSMGSVVFRDVPPAAQSLPGASLVMCSRIVCVDNVSQVSLFEIRDDPDKRRTFLTGPAASNLSPLDYFPAASMQAIDRGDSSHESVATPGNSEAAL